MMPPPVTIGLPVFNGANFIEEAIQAHLAQSFQDFHLIISDNASTDTTQEICREYERADDRIRFVRQVENIGAARNYNHTFELSDSPLFKWSAHDDLIAPEFVERCVDALDVNPTAVLAASRIGRIDADGERISVDDYRIRLESPRVAVRLWDLLYRRGAWFHIFGLIRAEVVSGTGLHQSFIGSDTTMLAELALRGPFALIDEVLFERRVHDQAYSTRWTTGEMTDEEAQQWFDPAVEIDDREPVLFASYRDDLEPVLFASYRAAVERAPLSQRERRACRRVIALAKHSRAFRRRAVNLRRRARW